jgi:thiosulfate dehydrogenase
VSVPELPPPARRLIRVAVALPLVALACSPAQPETGRKPATRVAAPDSVAFAPPADSLIPNDAAGRSIRRGLALLVSTRDSLPDHVGGALQCVSCHPEAGRKPGAMPWVGVYARYPQYRSRSASVGLLEDRVNDCFLRSMNGKPLDPGGADMRDIVAYMAFLSRGVPVGAKVAGQGLTMLPAGIKGDSARGAALFPVTCARCHGPGGEGSAVYPPLWGARSFNIGAGMARVRTAAAFIRHNMPFDRPGTLTDQEASDLAAYVTSQPRPDLPGKEKDWPEGGAPADVPYRTLGAGAAAPTHR